MAAGTAIGEEYDDRELMRYLELTEQHVCSMKRLVEMHPKDAFGEIAAILEKP